MVFVCVYVYVREGLGVGGKGVLKNCLGGGRGGCGNDYVANVLVGIQWCLCVCVREGLGVGGKGVLKNC